MNASLKPRDDLSPRKAEVALGNAKSDSDARSELLTLLDSAPVGIHWVNADGIILWANQTELEMLGYERTEYIGHHITKFHADQEVIAEILCNLISGQTLDCKEVRLLHKDGSLRIGSVNSNVLWEAGKFVHTRCFTRDVTDHIVLEDKRKEAERQNAEDARIKGALFQLTDQLHRASSLDDIYSAALLAIQNSLRCSRSAILLYDDSGVMRFVGWHGLSENYRRAVEGHSPWVREDTNPQPVSIDDVINSDLDESLQATVLSEGIQALAFIPLLTDGKLIGKFMAYFDTPHAFSGEDVELSLSIARQLAFGIDHQRAEQALRENERRFREMIDALPVAIYTTDADGRLTYFNPAAIEFSGRVPELGTDRWCVTWKLYRSDGQRLSHDECPMAVALKEGCSVRGVEAIVERPDGTRRWFMPFPTPFKDSNGRVVGAINMLLDITERKHAEQALQQNARQLALITDIAPVYIAQCDTNARYKFVNQPYAARFGMDAREFKGRLVAEILGDDTYASITPYIAQVLRGECVEFDVAVRQSDGQRFMHCCYAPELGEDGKIVGWITAIVDISQRKLVEEALRESEEKLKETDRRKDEFLAMLSHELRNPLAPIANAVHLLRREQTQSPIFKQARAIIERQTGRLARLVDDLLEVSRITTGRIQLQIERIAMGGIIERAVETVRPLIEHHRHQLNVSLPPEPVWVQADGARLEQVVVNLLTNAAKYTDDGGCIELSVETVNNQIVLRVKDNGIGISSESLPHIFELFTQTERGLDRSQGGLGIGLALVQRLVSMHGGSVAAESVLGKGSQFTVLLPIASSRETTYASTEQSEHTAASSRRILIVDDNMDATESLAMLMAGAGHVVSTAYDGLEAIEMAAQFQPQVIFLDIGLPRLDGYEVAKRLRKSMCNVVLIALTGYGQSMDRERTRQAGFDHHLVKPVDFAIMEKILAEASEAPKVLQSH